MTTRKRSPATRALSAALCAALASSSFGPGAASAAAQEMAARAAAGPAPGAPVALSLAAAALSPAPLAPAFSSSLRPAFAVPSAPAAPLAAPLAAPAAAPFSAVPASSLTPAAAAPALGPGAAPALVRTIDERVARPLADPKTDSAEHLRGVFDGQRGAAGNPEKDSVAWQSVPGGYWALARPAPAERAAAAEPPGVGRRERPVKIALDLAAPSAFAGLAAKAAKTVVDAFAGAVVSAALRLGRGTTDAEFRAFVRRQEAAGRLDPSVAALLRPYRPARPGDRGLTFIARGFIWVRPELAAWPALFRLALVRELRRWKAEPARGPPPEKGAFRALLSQARESVAGLRDSGLDGIKVSGLELAMRRAQISLRLSQPYEILVVNPDTDELRDPRLYEGLSNGAAKVTALSGAEPAQALAAAAGKNYQAVVLGRPAALLPADGSRESARLDAALKQLDSLYVLATRLVPRSAAFAGSADADAYAKLAVEAERLRASGSPAQEMQAFEKKVRSLWSQIAAAKLKGVGAAGVAGGLYAGLRDRGTAFMSFGPEDRGVATWERLLRFWEGPDGGQFRVIRVDLDDGGHILMLRKIEARVGLWLRPIGGGRIETSVPRADDSDAGRAAARAALQSAGFAEHLALFDSLGVSVRHVFGAADGRQEIYVTVPRRNAEAIRRYVQTRTESAVGSSRADFQPHLIESAGLQDVPPLWQAGVTGAGGRIMWIDTGGDATHEDFAGRLDVIDMVNEGPEDWAGHGTHVAGISMSSGAPFLGMAKGATGTVAKVFSRDGQGASDGEIMGSASIAMQKGYDVVSLSLGSPGSSSDNLAEFFSQLTHQKNASGEYPIVTASAGNSGPFDRTLSQPAAGVDVIAVAAAAKSLDDGRPEIAFYSSAGGAETSRRYAVKRWRLKPDITGIGGDVTTKPGSANVYEQGVYSAKSKNSPRSASDLPDGRHTGMSGTSMSNPAVAGIALLVKLALKTLGAETPFVAENLPFAVKAILMRSAKDLEAPVWFQGAGLVDAWAAAKLVGAAAGRAFSAKLKGFLAPGAAPAEGWGWLERLKAASDAEERAFREAELPKDAAAAAANSEDEPSSRTRAFDEEPADGADSRARVAGDSPQAEAVKRFNAARDREAPALIAALKDPVWLVRQRAALALMNLRASSAAPTLAEIGLGDEDARVRQMALLALAELPAAPAVDARLRQGAADPRWDVGVYAAYALARRGDRAAADRVVREIADPDKRARYAASWLAGQLGERATAVAAEALSARVKDRSERGFVRHIAAAALSNLAEPAPEAISDRVVTDLLDAAGTENLALTRTISKFFPVAVNDRAFVARLRAEPLKTAVAAFVLKNKGALQKPGALAELVSLLARAADIPLDEPTSAPDPNGAGVAGVDAALGALDLLVTPPSGTPAAYADESAPRDLARLFAAAGLDAPFLSRYESSARAALPRAGALWLSVPEHELHALTLALEARGFATRLALPEYPLASGGAGGPGVLLDLGTGESRPELPEGVDLSLVRVRAADGVSEARVMAALELVAARARGKGPTVIALTLGAPTGLPTALSAQVDALVAAGVGVVVGAGNAGPALGTVASPGDARRAVVVAAAARGKGLQFYSSRGTSDAPRVTWTDLVDPLDPIRPLAAAAEAAARGALDEEVPDPADSALGTAVAAERTAEKLSHLAQVMAGAFAARGRALPAGWFPFLASVVASSTTPMPAYGAHEVGAGLFDDEGRARAALDARLADLDAVEREAAVAAAGSAAPSGGALGFGRRVLRALWTAARGLLPGGKAAEALVRSAAASAGGGDVR